MGENCAFHLFSQPWPLISFNDGGTVPVRVTRINGRLLGGEIPSSINTSRSVKLLPRVGDVQPN